MESFLYIDKNDSRAIFKYTEYKSVIQDFEVKLKEYDDSLAQSMVISNYVIKNRGKISELLNISDCEERYQSL